jgi:hypothetical protein
VDVTIYTTSGEPITLRRTTQMVLNQLTSMMNRQEGSYTIENGPKAKHRQLIIAGAHIVCLGVDG